MGGECTGKYGWGTGENILDQIQCKKNGEALKGENKILFHTFNVTTLKLALLGYASFSPEFDHL